MQSDRQIGFRWRERCLACICILLLAACAPLPDGQGGYIALFVLPVTPTAMPALQDTPEATATAPVETPPPIATATPTGPRILGDNPNAPLIAIDPGHGGRDVGAVHRDAQGRVDWRESEVNLQMALRLRDLLLARGYRVFLTREDDRALNAAGEDVNGDGITDHADELQARVDAINAVGADLLLSIHQNSFYFGPGDPAEDVGGTMTLYCRDRDFGDKNLRLARLVQAEVLRAFGNYGYAIRDRGVVADTNLEVPGSSGAYLVLLGPESERIARPSQMPGALCEVLFITNPVEAKLARDPILIARLAIAFADAVDAYFMP